MQLELDWEVFAKAWEDLAPSDFFTDSEELIDIVASYLRKRSCGLTAQTVKGCKSLFKDWATNPSLTSAAGTSASKVFAALADGAAGVAAQEQSEEEEDSLQSTPGRASPKNKKKVTEIQKLRAICHPALDKSRTQAVLAKLAELAELPVKVHYNSDPYARRGAAWRVQESMAEAVRMQGKLDVIGSAGHARRKLRVGQQLNAVDKTIDAKGDLPEMLEQARRAIGAACGQRESEMLTMLEEQRQEIKNQQAEGVQREKEKLSTARYEAEDTVKALKDLRARYKDATEPLKPNVDEEETRRRAAKKFKRVQQKASLIVALGNDVASSYQKSKDVISEEVEKRQKSAALADNVAEMETRAAVLAEAQVQAEAVHTVIKDVEEAKGGDAAAPPAGGGGKGWAKARQKLFSVSALTEQLQQIGMDASQEPDDAPLPKLAEIGEPVGA